MQKRNVFIVKYTPNEGSGALFSIAEKEVTDQEGFNLSYLENGEIQYLDKYYLDNIEGYKNEKVLDIDSMFWFSSLTLAEEHCKYLWDLLLEERKIKINSIQKVLLSCIEGIDYYLERLDFSLEGVVRKFKDVLIDYKANNLIGEGDLFFEFKISWVKDYDWISIDPVMLNLISQDGDESKYTAVLNDWDDEEEWDEYIVILKEMTCISEPTPLLSNFKACLYIPFKEDSDINTLRKGMLNLASVAYNPLLNMLDLIQKEIKSMSSGFGCHLFNYDFK